MRRGQKLGFLGVTLSFVFALTLMNGGDVSALDCDSNASTKNACELDGNRGALWLNGVKSGSGIESDEGIEVEATNGKITLYLHGAVYKASSGATGNATCIRIKDYSISPRTVACSNVGDDMSGVSRSSDELYRGIGVSGGWSTGWEGSSVRVTVDQSVFTDRGSYNASTDQYTYTFHVYRCYDGNKGAKSCYSDAVTVTLKIATYQTTYTSRTTATLKLNGSSTTTSVTSANDSWYQDNGQPAVTANYDLTPTLHRLAKIDWGYTLSRTDGDSRNGMTGYYLFSGESTNNTLTNWQTTSLAAGRTLTISNPLDGVNSVGVAVSSLISVDQSLQICRGVMHDSITNMRGSGDSYTAPYTHASSRACVRLSYPYHFEVDPDIKTRTNANAFYIGQSYSDISFSLSKGTSASDQTSLPSDLKYKVIYFYTGLNGTNGGGNSTFSSGDYSTHFVTSGSNNPSITTICNSLGLSNSTGCAMLKDNNTLSSSSASSTGTGSVTIPDNEDYVGSKLCVAIVNNYYSEDGVFDGYSSTGSSYWGMSSVSCSPVYKKPNFRVTGAPVYAENGITANLSKKTDSSQNSNNKMFGSWAEYAVVTGSQVTSSFGSAGLLSDGATTNDALCAQASLTIANNNCSSSTLTAGGVTADSSSVVAKVDSYLEKVEALADTTGPVSIGGNNFRINANRGLCYIDADSVTISANITAGENGCQIIIVRANTVKVASSVTYIDAWIMADVFYTCDSYTRANISELSALAGSACTQSLTVNGPVYAETLYLARTFGADGVGGVANDATASDRSSAETIQYPAKTYVWGYEQSVTNDVRIYESGTTEVAPRA